jgi:hypothetical protein
VKQTKKVFKDQLRKNMWIQKIKSKKLQMSEYSVKYENVIEDIHNIDSIAMKKRKFKVKVQINQRTKNEMKGIDQKF